MLLFFKKKYMKIKITALGQSAENTCADSSEQLYENSVTCGQSSPRVNLSDDLPGWVREHLMQLAASKGMREIVEETISYLVN